MFFIFGKIFGFFTEPSNLIATICTIGALLLLLRRQRAGSLMVTFGVLLLLVFGYSPAGNVLLLVLTERFPAWQSDGRAPDGIIVLGGAIDADASAARKALEFGSGAERIFGAIDLAKRFPNARVVFTGGTGALMVDAAAEAPLAGQVMESYGVSPDRIVLEGASRSTDENATFTRRLVVPKPGERWLLVTSAFHMPRSIGAFRAAGFDVEAYPVDFRTRGWADAAVPFDTVADGLVRTETAVHEYVGLLIYWLTGRSSALFPAPQPPKR